MPLRDKIEHAIQNQPCTVKDLKAKFGGDRGADRKVMEALDQLVHEAVICQKQGVFFTGPLGPRGESPAVQGGQAGEELCLCYAGRWHQ